MLPRPRQLIPSLPEKFDRWYPGQEEIFMQISQWLGDRNKRFLCADIPTGFGKSLLAIMLAMLNGQKAVYMTFTTALQEQLMGDFQDTGMVDIRGQNRYKCIQFPTMNVEQAPCHNGYRCPVKSSCNYYSQLLTAKLSRLDVTNYSYWLAQNNYSDGFVIQSKMFSEVKLAIMDEAHQADKALESFLKVEFGPEELAEFPDTYRLWNWNQWQVGCQEIAPRIDEEVQELGGQAVEIFNVGGDVPRSVSGRLTYLKRLAHKLDMITGSKVEWVKEEVKADITFTPKWVRDYKQMLFLGVPKVLLMSAFLTPKTAELLGVGGDDTTWIEAPDPFDSANTPITHVSTTRVDFKMPDSNKRHWARRIDDIIRGRQDRKGIVFTVSYKRGQEFYDSSEFKDQIFMHGPKDVWEVVERFKKAPPPAVLVSPTVTTGWDFSGKTCEYIVIGKVPQPDSTGEVIKARRKEDPEWPSYLAMQTLVQEAGRGTRNERDRCEVLVVDDHFSWFWHNYSGVPCTRGAGCKVDHKSFAPGWFRERYVGRVDVVPRALERIIGGD